MVARHSKLPTALKSVDVTDTNATTMNRRLMTSLQTKLMAIFITMMLMTTFTTTTMKSVMETKMDGQPSGLVNVAVLLSSKVGTAM